VENRPSLGGGGTHSIKKDRSYALSAAFTDEDQRLRGGKRDGFKSGDRIRSAKLEMRAKSVGKRRGFTPVEKDRISRGTDLAIEGRRQSCNRRNRKRGIFAPQGIHKINGENGRYQGTGWREVPGEEGYIQGKFGLGGGGEVTSDLIKSVNTDLVTISSLEHPGVNAKSKKTSESFRHSLLAVLRSQEGIKFRKRTWKTTGRSGVGISCRAGKKSEIRGRKNNPKAQNKREFCPKKLTATMKRRGRVMKRGGDKRKIEELGSVRGEGSQSNMRCPANLRYEGSFKREPNRGQLRIKRHWRPWKQES